MTSIGVYLCSDDAIDLRGRSSHPLLEIGMAIFEIFNCSAIGSRPWCSTLLLAAQAPLVISDAGRSRTVLLAIQLVLHYFTYLYKSLLTTVQVCLNGSNLAAYISCNTKGTKWHNASVKFIVAAFNGNPLPGNPETAWT
jgi:hypothetical protein